MLYGWSTQANSWGPSGQPTIPGNLLVSGNLEIDGTIDVAGAAVLQSTLAATGLITASAGITAGVNQHVTISGTGKLKHGDETIPLAGSAFLGLSTWSFDGNTTWSQTAASGNVSTVLRLSPGVRVKTVEFTYNRGGAGTMNFYVFKHPKGTATFTQLVTSAVAAGTGITTVTLTPTYTVEADNSVVILVDGNNAANRFYDALVTIDRP